MKPAYFFQGTESWEQISRRITDSCSMHLSSKLSRTIATDENVVVVIRPPLSAIGCHFGERRQRFQLRAKLQVSKLLIVQPRQQHSSRAYTHPNQDADVSSGRLYSLRVNSTNTKSSLRRDALERLAILSADTPATSKQGNDISRLCRRCPGTRSRVNGVSSNGRTSRASMATTAAARVPMVGYALTLSSCRSGLLTELLAEVARDRGSPRPV
jgi:hypothetical protein